MLKKVILVALVVVSCQSNSSDRIDIPENMPLSQHNLLEQILEKSRSNPTDERLLMQGLYYCEELEWPELCEESLLRAKKRWGLTDELTDKLVGYYLNNGNFDELQSILKSAVETRPRLEAKIRIATQKKEDINGLLNRYSIHYKDIEATIFAINSYLEIKDTAQSIVHFEKLNTLDSMNELLRSFHPILMARNKFAESIYFVNNQLVNSPNDTTLLIDLAISLYEKNETDSAKNILRRMNSSRNHELLATWFKKENNWDSTLFYLDKMLIRNPSSRSLLLDKAETLESKRWVTKSLMYYERVLQMDPSDSVMQARVEIVRRKVAYLRQIKEKKELPLLINLKRKTTTDN